MANAEIDAKSPVRTRARKRLGALAAVVLLCVYTGSYVVLSLYGEYDPAAVGTGSAKACRWAPAGFCRSSLWSQCEPLLYWPLYFVDANVWHRPLAVADYTSVESDTCEIHHIRMTKRIVPIAFGMIPMTRVEAERGEWNRRIDHYPHPGDCRPSIDIVMPGEDSGQAVEYVCPKCEAAKRQFEKGER